MSKDVAVIFAATVVSWVMFIFNFVLGYYMGRAVEAAERIKNEQKKYGKKREQDIQSQKEDETRTEEKSNLNR